jgi:hypothetical protein
MAELALPPVEAASTLVAPATVTAVARAKRSTNTTAAAAAAGSDAGAPRPKRVKKLVVDDALLAEGRAWVRAKRRELSRATSVLEVLDVVSLHLHLRHQAWQASQKPGRPAAHAWAHEVGDILGRSTNVTGRAWKAFAEQRQLYLHSPSTGPRGFKARRIPRTKRLRVAIRKFLLDKQVQGERVVADTLTSFLCENGFLPARLRDAGGKDRLAVQRCVQRLVTDLGLRRGHRGTILYKEKGHTIALRRDEYIRTMLSSRLTRRIVYLDACYLSHHDKLEHNDTVNDPADDREVTRPKHKGQGFYLIGAIIGEDPTVPAAQRQDRHQAQLLRSTVKIFTGSKQAKEAKDDHGMFDPEYFLTWMDELLAELARLEVHNALIVLDDAKYHKSVPLGTPRPGMKKADLIAACRQLGIEVQEHMSKKALWARAEPWVQANVRPATVAKAAEAGHQVLFLPRPYSDLLPIELVWAHVRDKVGRTTHLQRTASEVKTELEQAFEELAGGTVDAFIQHAWNELGKLAATLEHLDEAGDEETDSDDGSDSEVSEAYDDGTGADAEDARDFEAVTDDDDEEEEEEGGGEA